VAAERVDGVAARAGWVMNSDSVGGFCLFALHAHGSR
jgi:hypothetical protein